MAISRLKVGGRIYSGFATIIAVGIGVAGFGVLQMSYVGHQVGEMDTLSANVTRVLQVSLDLETIRRTETLVRLDGSDALLAELKEHEVHARSLLAEAIRTSLNQDHTRVYVGVEDSLRAHDAILDQFVELNRTARAERAKQLNGAGPLAAAAAALLDAARGRDGLGLEAAAEAVGDAVSRVRVVALRFLATDEAGGPAAFNASVDKVGAALVAFGQAAGPDGARLVEPVRSALAVYVSAFNGYVASHPASVVLYDTQLKPSIIAMQRELGAAQTSLTSAFDSRREATRQALSHTALLQEIVAGFALVLGIVLAALIGRGIVRPVTAMTAAMTRLARGDKSVNVPARERTDEVGDMARAVEVFRQNAIEADRLAVLQQAEATLKEQRTTRMDTLVRGFENRVGQMVGLLAAASTELEATAQSMSSTAEQTNQQATTVAGAAEQASVGVQTVAAAAEELTTSIAEISRQVMQSARMTGRAAEDARRTDAVVQALSEGAQKIGAVVGLITSIAGQTNLLALNATIEAARAGDAGKGFAVVASEVKSLAQQTAKATDEISAHIAQIQGTTREAVESIRSIASSIEEVSTIAVAISAAVEEQGAATAEIARNVAQTATNTQEVTSNISGVSLAANNTGTAASQVLGSASGLSRQAEELSGEVRSFVESVRAA